MADATEILNIEWKAKKPILLYFYPAASSFVNQDIETFRIRYTIRVFPFQPSKKILLPISFVREKVFLIRYIFSAEILVCQFAGYHSLLPVLFAKLFKKPVVIIVGGTDCVSMPSINYGNLRKPLLRWFTLKSLKKATHIISPSQTLVQCDYNYSNSDFPGQGFRYFDKSVSTPFTVIYNGIDTSHFRIMPEITRRPRSFLTICITLDKRNFRLKGIDLFISMAESNPECEFTIIGRAAAGFEFSMPSNMKLIDFVRHEELPGRMAGFSFYCQLSMSEGFGVALAEAMACGCVPIVSRVGIMDYIVGDTGFILDKYDTGLLRSLTDTALKSDTEKLGAEASKRISMNFDKQKRRDDLLKLLQDITK